MRENGCVQHWWTHILNAWYRSVNAKLKHKWQTAQNKMIRYLLNYGCRSAGDIIGFSDFNKSNCLDINARVDYYVSLNLMFNIFNNVRGSFLGSSLSRDARTNWPDVVGTTFVDRTTNDNDQRLLSFCRSTGLCIADSWFPRKQIPHWTRYQWWFHEKSHRSHHHLASMAAMRHTVPCMPRRPTREHRSPSPMRKHIYAWNWRHLTAGSRQHHQSDISRLADHSTKLQYQCEISNSYDALAESTDQWEDFKNTITACATKCLGRKRPRPKKPGITPVTLEITESRRLHGDLTEYRRLNSVRNSSIKNARAAFWQEKANHPGRGCYL